MSCTGPSCSTRTPLCVHLSPWQATTLFAGFVAIHVTVWTLIPIFLDHAGPVDVLEGLAWGREWQLGYYKHPPLQAWLLESVSWLFGRRLWACFLLSQVAVAVSFWAVWRLASLIVRPLGALIAVLLLEGIAYFTRISPEFNPNVLQLPFWALAAWSFYRAIRSGGVRDWALLGLWLALAAYSKYSSVFLALAMIGFLVLDSQARSSWRTPGPYLCAAVCTILLTPHLWWMAQNGFVTLRYPLGETTRAADVWDRLFFALDFARGQLIRMLPAVLLVLALCWRRATGGEISLADGETAFARRFVFALALGPFLLVVASSTVAGLSLHNHWGYPLWCFIGLFAVLLLSPSTGVNAFRRFLLLWGAVFAAVPLVSAVGLATSPYVRAAGWVGADQFMSRSLLYPLLFERFPGEALAREVTAQWHKKVGGRIAYVVGDTWIAGNIAFHSPDRREVSG